MSSLRFDFSGSPVRNRSSRTDEPDEDQSTFGGFERNLGEFFRERSLDDGQIVETLARIPQSFQQAARIVAIRQLGANRASKLCELAYGTKARLLPPVFPESAPAAPVQQSESARLDYARARGLADVLAALRGDRPLVNPTLAASIFNAAESHVALAARSLLRGRVEGLKFDPYKGCVRPASAAAAMLRVADRHGATLFREEARAADRAEAPDDPAVAAALGAIGHGEPLSLDLRREMESMFGRSFERVRIHKDDIAGRAAHAVNARAFTVGEDIFFAPLEKIEGAEGKRLLAHELTHVAQHQDGRTRGAAGGSVRISDTSDPLEIEAESVARGTLAGGEDRADTNAPAAVAGAPSRPRPSGMILRSPGPPRPVPNNARYPIDANPWKGIEILDVVRDELPVDVFATSSFLEQGWYRLYPQLRNHAQPHAAYYVAYQTKNERAEWAVGASEVDEFLAHWLFYGTIAGNFYGVSSSPRKYEITSAQVGYFALKGDFKSAIRALGQSWKEALRDPAWYLQAVPATLGGVLAGAEAKAATGAAAIEGRGLGKLPAGAKIVEDGGASYVVYENAGQQRIRFKASESVTLQEANPGRNYTTETCAGVSQEGKPFVYEGRHRAIGAANGDVVHPSNGGVPDAPGVLDYEFTSAKDAGGVPVKDLKIDYSQPDVAARDAAKIWDGRHGRLDGDKR